MAGTHSRLATEGSGRPLPLIVSSGTPFGAYDMVRCLGMHGIRSAVASSERTDVAFRSRHSARTLIVADFEESNYATILDAIVTLCSSLDEQPVLYYVSDPELDFVLKNRGRLSEHVRMLLPTESILRMLVNKTLFPRLAQAHGLPVPETFVARSAEELRERVRSIRFPCIVKPAFSHDWVWDSQEQQTRFGPYKKALRRFCSVNELIDFCEALPVRASGFLVQSYIDGRDESIVSFHGYFDERSVCLGSFVGEKIRTYPAHTGGSVYVRTVHNDELSRLSIEYLQRIGYRGIVKIDYKWDSVSREYKILEINPRYNLWQLLGAYAGVNLAAIAFDHQRGEPIIQSQPSAGERRLILFRQDLRAYLQDYRRSGEWTARAYMKSLLAKKVYRVFDPTDPAPFLFSCLNFFHRAVQRIFRSGGASIAAWWNGQRRKDAVTLGTAIDESIGQP